MKQKLLLLLALAGIVIAVCDEPVSNRMRALEKFYWGTASPQMDLPPQFRRDNPNGSCVHCTTKMLLHWVNEHELAELWWSKYQHGENAGRHTERMEIEGIKFAVTTDGDDELLEFALASRRGMGVGDTPMHCRALVGRVEHDGELCAVILDNNHIDRYIYEPWEQWRRQWKNQGGWGFVILSGEPNPETPSI